jgi:histidine triad (HIT) family protein
MTEAHMLGLVSQGCVFCGIADGSVPAQIVAQTERLVAFRDVKAQAPTHVLVIPRTHYRDVAELARADPGLAGELVELSASVAAGEGLGEGWRLVFNTGAAAGQTVWHVHAHVLGGRAMSWPPG